MNCKKDIFEFKTIAHIHTDFPEKFGIPRQSGLVKDARGKVIFLPEFRHPDAIKGIEEYDRLWILFIFSENIRKDSSSGEALHWNATVTPPRLGGKEHKGVFAARSPFRPNPVGLSCVELKRAYIDEKLGPVLEISGVDMLDGTPVVDIKPYIPYADAFPESRGSFGEEGVLNKLKVIIPEELLDLIPEENRNAVKDIIAEDPRPAFIHDEDRVWGVSYAGMNIRFTVKGGMACVTEVLL